MQGNKRWCDARAGAEPWNNDSVHRTVKACRKKETEKRTEDDVGQNAQAVIGEGRQKQHGEWRARRMDVGRNTMPVRVSGLGLSVPTNNVCICCHDCSSGRFVMDRGRKEDDHNDQIGEWVSDSENIQKDTLNALAVDGARERKRQVRRNRLPATAGGGQEKVRVRVSQWMRCTECASKGMDDRRHQKRETKHLPAVPTRQSGKQLECRK